ASWRQMSARCWIRSVFWTPNVAVCQYHQDRPGVGVCMRCRAVICASCCTRVYGVNHCHVCLKSLGQAAKTRQRHGAPLALLAVLVLGVTGLAFCGIGLLVQGILAP